MAPPTPVSNSPVLRQHLPFFTSLPSQHRPCRGALNPSPREPGSSLSLGWHLLPTAVPQSRSRFPAGSSAILEPSHLSQPQSSACPSHPASQRRGAPHALVIAISLASTPAPSCPPWPLPKASQAPALSGLMLLLWHSPLHPHLLSWGLPLRSVFKSPSSQKQSKTNK